ncbi:class I SAM-dependent methyltransferase [Alphaproteobacteria bacterium]|nr:class I SAM-dependent methyltransferase [Alphaproteobacteria bacterium]
MIKSYKRNTCRLCESTDINLKLSLTPTPPADSYFDKENQDTPLDEIPLDLYLCNSCGNTQLGHVIDAEEVYNNYIYETASTLGLGPHFKKCADTVMNKFQPIKGGLVVDIGSNDGILLKYFKEHGMNILGIDPMPGIAEKASKQGVPTLPNFFDQKFSSELRSKNGPASIITSNNLVADTDDLKDFILGIKNLMDEESIFFFETFYFYLQVKNLVWDFTYHEHYSYFTVKPLKLFFKSLGMKIIDVEDNNTKGGSMRVTLQLENGNRDINQSVEDHVLLEEQEGFQTSEIFSSYNERINKSKIDYQKLINEIRENDKNAVIAGYGASATSTTLIYHFEMGEYLSYLVDDFEAKHNLFSPGLKIPCFSSDYIYSNKPDYIIILAWRYADKIISSNQKFLDQGGKFILPLTEAKIIG